MTNSEPLQYGCNIHKQKRHPLAGAFSVYRDSAQKLLGDGFGQFQSDVFVGVGEQDDQADNQGVDCQ
jgi:hypothetical protein